MSGYVMVPGWFLDLCPDGAELKVYCVLARYGHFHTGSGTYVECRPSVATIARDSGMSESHVKRALAGLVAKGAAKKTERRGEGGASLPSVYVLQFGRLVAPSTTHEPPPSTGEPLPPSTGEPPRGSQANPDLEPDTQNQNTQRTTSTASRGTRLNPDFIPTEGLRAWFVDKRLGEVIDGLAEHEKFVDYWIAQPGARGVKKDWEATWRTWMRTAAERAAGRRTGRPAGGGFQSAQERSNAALDREAEIARVAEAIVESRGGNPESFTEVSPVMARLKAEPALLDLLLPVLALPVPEQAAFLERTLQALHQQNGSAPRTSGLYSEGDGYIDGQVREHREVTSHASE